MPQYELMYLLGSNVADPDVPGITEQIKKFVADFGGSGITEENLGKKKLAYPIKKTRNGTYVVVNFTMDTTKINDLDAKIRTQDQSIVRYLIVNLDEHMARLEKDKVAQASLTRRPEVTEEEKPAAPKVEAKKEPIVLEPLDEKALDEKIEAALTEDLTK